ncbi:MAG: hypothetical protein SPL35_04400, partial [Bacteroidales bacterium]|nr:hypothetical protein [Bacteroidales bacterium]
PQYQQPAQPQYQQPAQPQYQYQQQVQPQYPQYQQPVAAPKEGKSSDAAVLIFAILFFVSTAAMAVLRFMDYSPTLVTIYGICTMVQAASLLLVPFGIKKAGIKATAFILLGLVVIWLVLSNLTFFGINIF